MKNTLLQNIDSTFLNLKEVLNSINETEFDTVPFEGSWTVGQVAEHIIKSTAGMENIVSKNTVQTDRNPSEKLKGIEDIFLNFNLKMESPEFIIPVEKTHDKKEILNTISEIEKSFLIIANEFDLTLECQNFELPGFGKLTIFELLGFALAHTQRHTRQLKNIQKILITK